MGLPLTFFTSFLPRARKLVEEAYVVLVRLSLFSTPPVDTVLAYSFLWAVDFVSNERVRSGGFPKQTFHAHATVTVHPFQSKAALLAAAYVLAGRQLLCQSRVVESFAS